MIYHRPIFVNRADGCEADPAPDTPENPMNMLTRRAALATAAGLAFALPALADDKAKTKVEFRRAEKTAAEGLTEATVAGTKEKVYLHKAADLTGADIASARVAGDAKDPTIEITFTEAGAKKAAKVSEDHADKPIAIVVDGKVLAAPVVRAKLGTTIRISGNFTGEEAAKIVKGINGK
jgi:preprotein translocase subunit SecD